MLLPRSSVEDPPPRRTSPSCGGRRAKALDALSFENDELARRIAETFDKQSELSVQAQQEVRRLDQETANAMAVAAGGAHRKWWRQAFGAWLR